MEIQRLLLKFTTLYLLSQRQAACKICTPSHLTLTTLKPCVRLVTLKHIEHYTRKAHSKQKNAHVSK